MSEPRAPSPKARRVLVLATRNQGKLRELEALFDGLPIELRTLRAYPDAPEVIEDGETFEHNARKKACETAAALGEMVLADDSGLECDALDGRPGVRSARYAGQDASDEDNNQRLVRELASVPEQERGARYRVVLALCDAAGKLVHLEHGACEGRIRLQPAGTGGFGYDPYFEPQGYACTMAELSADEKNRISHRAVASRKLRAFLERFFAT